VGYGLIELRAGRPVAMAWGEIATPKHQSLPARLAMLEQDLTLLIGDHAPDVVAMELVMGRTMTASVREVYMAIGVLQLTVENCGLKAAEYHVGTWKKAVTGDGRAEKHEIQRAVQAHLDMLSLPTPDHAADALGVAYHHMRLHCRGVA
jgi:crossover junction endodeoxyribonuclease RuvC